jgi:arylsulfatase A-like enzyme
VRSTARTTSAKEWADKYKGKFDDGWDAYRERVFKRAREKGWIPDSAQLTPRHETMPSWELQRQISVAG